MRLLLLVPLLLVQDAVAASSVGVGVPTNNNNSINHSSMEYENGFISKDIRLQQKIPSDVQLEATTIMHDKIQLAHDIMKSENIHEQIDFIQALSNDLMDMNYQLDIINDSIMVTSTTSSSSSMVEPSYQESFGRIIASTKPLLDTAMKEMQDVLSYMNTMQMQQQQVSSSSASSSTGAAGATRTTGTGAAAGNRSSSILKAPASYTTSLATTSTSRRRTRNLNHIEDQEERTADEEKKSHYHYHETTQGQQGGPRRYNPYKGSSAESAAGGGGTFHNFGGQHAGGNPFAGGHGSGSSFHRHGTARRMLKDHPLLKNLNLNNNMNNSDSENARKRRQMQEEITREDRCELLKDCVNKMSMYDLFVYFHSDDIDDNDGSVDDNVRTYDESNIYNKFVKIKQLAENLNTADANACSTLLKEFHRNIENGSADSWEGASISQVCLAEGTSVYVKVEDIATISTTVAGEVFQDTIRCAYKLWNSDNRKGYSSGEKFVFDNPSSSTRELAIPVGYNHGSNQLDEHGHMNALPTTYPFKYELPKYSSISFGGGYPNFYDGECEGTCGDTKRYECERMVQQCYYDIYASTYEQAIGTKPCYPDYIVEGRNNNDRRYHYYQFIDPNHSCYSTASTISSCTKQCTGWYEDDAALKANDTPPCRKGEDGKCVAAKMNTASGVTLFSGEDFSRIDTAIELVFGERSSVGFICSIANSVVDDNLNLPGRCCLDAPYQNLDNFWGTPVSLTVETFVLRV